MMVQAQQMALIVMQLDDGIFEEFDILCPFWCFPMELKHLVQVSALSGELCTR
jgi:hypothetical protein